MAIFKLHEQVSVGHYVGRCQTDFSWVETSFTAPGTGSPWLRRETLVFYILVVGSECLIAGVFLATVAVLVDEKPIKEILCERR